MKQFLINLFSICSHKYGPLDENGYQYCTLCNKARQLNYRCSHVWMTVDKFTVSNRITNHITKWVIVSKCKKCGILNKFDIGINDYV